MKRPYVGVDGVISRDQADDIHSIYSATIIDGKRVNSSNARRQLKYGVKVALSTGRVASVGDYDPSLYVVDGDLREVADGYNYPEEVWVAKASLDPARAGVGSAEYEAAYLGAIASSIRGWADGIQIDGLVWEHNDYHQLFEGLLRRSPDLGILMHCRVSLQSWRDQLKSLVRSGMYRETVDQMIFEAPIDDEGEPAMMLLDGFIEAAGERGVMASVGGGLNANRVRRYIPPIIRRYADVSVDAESQLHINPDGGSQLNLEATRQYLQALAEVLRYDDNQT